MRPQHAVLNWRRNEIVLILGLVFVIENQKIEDENENEDEDERKKLLGDPGR